MYDEDKFEEFDKTQAELTGWWTGSIYISDMATLTQEQYDEFIDPEAVSFNMAKSLVEHGKETGEAVHLWCLKDEYIERTKDDILRDMEDDYSTIGSGFQITSHKDKDLSLTYGITINCTLEDQDFDFEDLSEETKEHIINAIFDGYPQGEICEYNPCYIEDYWDEYNIDDIDIKGVSYDDPALVYGNFTINGAEYDFQYHVVAELFTVDGYDYDEMDEFDGVKHAIKEEIDEYEFDLSDFDITIDEITSSGVNVTINQEPFTFNFDEDGLVASTPIPSTISEEVIIGIEEMVLEPERPLSECIEEAQNKADNQELSGNEKSKEDIEI